MQSQVGALETGAVEDKIELKSTETSMADKERRHLSWAQAREMPCNLLLIRFYHSPTHVKNSLTNMVSTLFQCRSPNH
jgi:hypothetical protein